MTSGRRAMAIAVGATLVVAACGGSSGDDGTDDNVVATTASGSTAGSATTARPSVGSGDFMLPDPGVGLATLTSYRAELTLTFRGTDGGQPQRWVSTTEMLRSVDPRVVQVTIENSGDTPAADPSYLAEADGVAYRSGANGCTAQAFDPAVAGTALVDPIAELPPVMGAERLGERTIGGIDAVGYTFDERAVGHAGRAETVGEVWLATQGGYVLEYTMTAEGSERFFGEGVSGALTWWYEVTDVNDPVTIELPAGCAAAPLTETTGAVTAPSIPSSSVPGTQPG